MKNVMNCIEQNHKIGCEGSLQ